MSDTPPASAYDVAVLGGGSAGFAAARATGKAGLNTALIDGADVLGGLCILRGCMPTKALLYAAEVLHLSRRSPLWGITGAHAGFDYAALMARKSAVIDDFASYRRQQLENGPFRLIRARARFVDPHTVQLENGAQITARHFIVATGSIVAPPPLRQLEKVGYLTSDDAINLRSLPASLIVLGGGPIAVEFAQFFARLDVGVTMIQRSEHILKDLDEDAAAVIERALIKEGVKLHTGTRLLDAQRDGDKQSVVFDQADHRVEVAADQILLALGRLPNTAALNLAAAGVQLEEAGRIQTNERMQTSAPHIYAAGDCTSRHEIVHEAIHQAELAAHNIIHADSPRTLDGRLSLNLIFSDPQVACVGLTEKSARAAGRNYVSASYPFTDHGKSIIMGAEDGFVKLLADPGSGEIIGGCCVGPAAGELIHEIVVAMAGRMTARELAVIPHYHPTLAEIWTYPAEELAEKV
jgi:pyruvate/2-oxoglutarate dehydrogenase complex dihydrolipoamide dehydrogenase (E3) component